MGIGKIARGVGKVGLLLEGLTYAVAAGKALMQTIKGDPAARRDGESRQDHADDISHGSEGEG
jgi:hypothetical protein